MLAWLSVLERGADLHMAQLMPLPLTVSSFSKIQIGFTSLVPAHPGSSGQTAVKRVCVCVCVLKIGVFQTSGRRQGHRAQTRPSLMEKAVAQRCLLTSPSAHSIRSTQPCIPPGSLNRVPALAGLTAGMSPLPGGR